MPARVFLAVLLVCILSHAQAPLASTCAGACGGPAADGACHCDEACSNYGDCCADVCAQCPTLPGCGGGGGDCGGVSFEGCCQGETLKYCDGGQLQTVDCISAGPSCGWQPEGPFYDCGTSGGADPSGANPKSCSGGGGPVCGNGVCESGESQANCPGDCNGAGPVCGNGSCEAGETQAGCPADCGGGADCAGKECGSPKPGVTCGSCPEGNYCHYEFYCVPKEGICTPVCEGKQCGDDGCDGSCGECPAGLVCSGAGTCTSPGLDGNDITEDYGDCEPDCGNRVCGDNGCGGSCGYCPAEHGCTPGGLCEPGYVPIDDDPYECPEGQILNYGKCIPDPSLIDDSSGDGCVANPTGRGASATTFMLLLLGLFLLLRLPALKQLSSQFLHRRV